MTRKVIAFILSGMMVSELLASPGSPSQIPSSPPTIIHIHDIHHHLGAQTDISNFISTLIKSKSISLIALEGAFKPIKLNFLKKSGHTVALKQAADFLLKHFDISGPVHAALSTLDTGPRIIGVDDAVHYEANVSAVRTGLKIKKKAQLELSKYKSKFERYRRQSLKRSLFVIDESVQAYARHRISIDTHIELLCRMVDISHLSPNIKKFCRASKLLPLLRDTELKKSDPTKLIVLLRRYQDMVKAINAEELFKEITFLEKEGYETHKPSLNERQIILEGRQLILTEKLICFSLTREEWQEYKQRPFGMEMLVPFEQFYREAEIRDEKMAQNLLRQISDQGHVVLVTGGFHAQGIDQRLKSAGFNVVPYVPRITNVEAINGSAYLDSFDLEKHPNRKIFNVRRVSLAEAPISDEILYFKLPALLQAVTESGHASFMVPNPNNEDDSINRILEIPFRELWLLPGLSLALLAISGAWPLAIYLGSLLVVLRHGKQSLDVFIVRMVGTILITSLALSPGFHVPLNLLIAYVGHALWNWSMPLDWNLTLPNKSNIYSKKFSVLLKKLKSSKNNEDARQQFLDYMEIEPPSRSRAFVYNHLRDMLHEPSDFNREAALSALLVFLDHSACQKKFLERALKVLIDRIKKEKSSFLKSMLIDSVLTIKLTPDLSPQFRRNLFDVLKETLRITKNNDVKRRLFVGLFQSPIFHSDVLKSADFKDMTRMIESQDDIPLINEILNELIGQLPQWEKEFNQRPEFVAQVVQIIPTLIEKNKLHLAIKELNLLADHVIRFYPKVGRLYEELASYLVNKKIISESENKRLGWIHRDFPNLARAPIEIHTESMDVHVIGKLQYVSDASLVQSPEWKLRFKESRNSETYVEKLPPLEKSDSPCEVVVQNSIYMFYYPAQLVSSSGDVLHFMLLLGQPFQPQVAKGSEVEMKSPDHDIPFPTIGLTGDANFLDRQLSWFPLGGKEFYRPSFKIDPKNRNSDDENWVMPLGYSKDRIYFLFEKTGVIFSRQLQEHELKREREDMKDLIESMGGVDRFLELQEMANVRFKILGYIYESLQQLSGWEKLQYRAKISKRTIQRFLNRLEMENQILFDSIFTDADLIGLTGNQLLAIIDRYLLSDGRTADLKLIDSIFSGLDVFWVPALLKLLTREGRSWMLREAFYFTKEIRRRERGDYLNNIVDSIRRLPKNGRFAPVRRRMTKKFLNWLRAPTAVDSVQMDLFDYLSTPDNPDELVPGEIQFQQRLAFGLAVGHRASASRLWRLPAEFVPDISHQKAVKAVGHGYSLARSLFDYLGPVMRDNPIVVPIEIRNRPGGRKHFLIQISEGQGVRETLAAAAEFFPIDQNLISEVEIKYANGNLDHPYPDQIIMRGDSLILSFRSNESLRPSEAMLFPPSLSCIFLFGLGLPDVSCSSPLVIFLLALLVSSLFKSFFPGKRFQNIPIGAKSPKNSPPKNLQLVYRFLRET